MGKLLRLARRCAGTSLICAAIWLALDLPFRALGFLNLIPPAGPKNALPALFGLVFGPAGCWGCALGALLSGLLRGVPYSVETLCESAAVGLAPLALYLLWYVPRAASVPSAKKPLGALKYALFAFSGGILSGWAQAALCAGKYGVSFTDALVQAALSTLAWSVLLGLPALITMTSVFAVRPAVPGWHKAAKKGLAPGLALKADSRESLGSMAEALEDFIFENSIPPKQGYAIQSCVEELAVLIFDRLGNASSLRAEFWAGDTVVIELAYAGEKYNPLAVRLKKGGAEANIDALGILMVRQMAITARFTRREGVNNIKIVV